MENVCRTCLRIIESTFSITHLSRSEKTTEGVSIRKKLRVCVPELTLDIVSDPALCSTCTSALTFAYQFKTTCLQTEKTLYTCIQKRKKQNPNFADLLSRTDLLQIARKGIKDEHSYSYVQRYSPVDNSYDDSTDDQEPQHVKFSHRVQSSLGEIVKQVSSSDKQKVNKSKQLTKSEAASGKKLDKSSQDVSSKKLSQTIEDVASKKVDKSSEDVSSKKLNKVSVAIVSKKLHKTSEDVSSKKLNKSSEDVSSKKLNKNTEDVSSKKVSNVAEAISSKKKLKKSADTPNKKLDTSSEEVGSSKSSQLIENVSKKRLNKTPEDVVSKKKLNKSNDKIQSPKQIAVNKALLDVRKSPRRYTNTTKLQDITPSTPVSSKPSSSTAEIDLKPVVDASDINIESVIKKVSSSPIKRSIDKIMKKLKDHADHDCGTIVNTDLGGVSSTRSEKKMPKMPKIRLGLNVQKTKDQKDDAEFEISSRKLLKEPPATRQISIKRTCREQNEPKTQNPVATANGNIESDESINDTTKTPTITKRETSDRYQCTKCDKGYKFKSHFDVHLKSHIIEKLFSCPICKKDFTQEKYLKSHELTHISSGNYQCSLCLKCLSSCTALKRHIVIHTGEKAFACTHCGKRFAQQIQCTVHMRTHTGDRPYLCNVCNTTFTQKSHLLGHMLIHTGEKPFKCDMCPKAFRKVNALNIHHESHKKKPFQCRSCSFLFKDREILRKHINKHLSGRLPMKSKFVVNKKSKQILIDKLKEDVKKMELKGGFRENDASSTTCTVCKKTFSNVYTRNRHMKNHN